MMRFGEAHPRVVGRDKGREGLCSDESHRHQCRRDERAQETVLGAGKRGRNAMEATRVTLESGGDCHGGLESIHQAPMEGQLGGKKPLRGYSYAMLWEYGLGYLSSGALSQHPSFLTSRGTDSKCLQSLPKL